MATDDSNPFIEWEDAEPTVTDDGTDRRQRAPTAPHDLTDLARATERDEAYRRGLRDGVELAIAALYRTMRLKGPGMTRHEMDNIALNVRKFVEWP